MPNLQTWLNAWVNVNNKQAQTSSHRGSGSHHGSSSRSSLHRSKSLQKMNNYNNNGSSGAITSNTTPTTPSSSSRSIPHTPRSVQSNSSQQQNNDQLEQYKEGTSRSSHDRTFINSNNTGTTGAPRGSKHKRSFFHRTNSFSDLIREQARPGRHSSVERPNNNDRQRSSSSSSSKRKRRLSRRGRHRQPPETLHHDPEIMRQLNASISEGSSSAISSSAASTPSLSSTQAIRRKSRLRYSSSNTASNSTRSERLLEHTHANKEVLFDVAEFFGTAKSEQRTADSRIIPTTASTGARHQTHRAQHGLETEQPHYLIRSYNSSHDDDVDEDDDDDFDQHLQNISSSSATAPIRINHQHQYPSPSPTFNISNELELHHHDQDQLHNMICANHDDTTNDATISPATTTTTTGTTRLLNNAAIHRRRSLEDTRTACFAYPTELPSPSAKTETKTPSPCAKTETKTPSPTTKSTTMGLVVGGSRAPFFAQSNNTVTTEVLTEASETNGETSKRTATTSNKNKNKNNDSNPSAVRTSKCRGCEIARSELLSNQESLEYMRAMAIRKEFTCHKCGADDDDATLVTSNSSCALQAPAAKKPLTAKNASAQLLEVTSRHKKQVEQLMKERNNMQRNMHLKLDKYTNLCSHLNNESAQRVEESQTLKEELETMRAERDQMASELVPLRAAVKDFENEREEHRLVRARMERYEHDGLNHAADAIAKRDHIVGMLSTRLETTLESLSIEREQHRQRRKIIFPPAAANGRDGNGQDSVSPEVVQHKCDGQGNGNADSTQQDELERLRSELADAQRRLESVQMRA